NQLNALSETSIFVIDDCDQEVTPVFTVVVTFSGDCTAFGYFERRVYTWSATDICGNEALLTFTIDIIDDVPPVFANVQDDTTVICAPLPSVPVMNITDIAMPVVTTFSETIVPGTEIGVFIVTRTWTATDACGNISTSVQTIHWIPNTFLTCEIILPPVIECNSHGVVITSAVTGGIGPYTYVWEISGEKCFIQGGQGTPAITIYVGWTDVKVILTVTDSFGCTSMCMIIVSCTDAAETGLALNLQNTHPEANQDLKPGLITSENPGDYLKKINLWPNPANENINLSFESSIDQNVEFVLMNLLGETVLKEKMEAHKGFNTKNFDVSNLLTSSYLMEVKSASEIHTKVIVLTRKD
ncbi:MAG: T9SS type A sorting domain-containing protein, partial [Saprospiraceae bacterium]